VVDRKNGEFATNAVLTQAAIYSALGNEGAKEFKKIIGTLLSEDEE